MILFMPDSVTQNLDIVKSTGTYVVTCSNFTNATGAYAKPTGQRSVGIPEENATASSDKSGPTNRNGSCHFLFLFRIP